MPPDIERHLDAYSNAELLHWEQTDGGKGRFPRNVRVASYACMPT
jgi:hypothetical protein